MLSRSLPVTLFCLSFQRTFLIYIPTIFILLPRPFYSFQTIYLGLYLAYDALTKAWRSLVHEVDANVVGTTLEYVRIDDDSTTA